MKEKVKELLILILTAAFLLGFAVWRVCKPDDAESLAERRKLTQAPALRVQNVLSGRFMSDFESYILDQFPLRDEFRTLKALFSTEALRQSDNHGLYNDRGFLSKLDYPLDESSVQNAAARFQAVYDRYLRGMQVYLAIVPDKNAYTSAAYPKLDYAALSAQMKSQMPYAQEIELSGVLTLESYYRTDPHWKQEALLPAARTILEAMGGTQEDSYHIVRLDTPFYGSYAGQSALPCSPDELNYLTSDTLEACRVYDYETESYTGVYDLSAAQGRDGYELFLSGSKALLTIDNPNARTQKELILFRDSYGSSIAPLLVEGYAKVTLVDIRYLSPELLGRFLEFKNQDVLFLYSTSVLNSSNALK